MVLIPSQPADEISPAHSLSSCGLPATAYEAGPTQSPDSSSANNLQVLSEEPCPSHPDKAALYEQLQPLIKRLLYRYGKTTELRLDLRGEIYYQFSQLVDSYQPERGIPIRAYLTRMLCQRVFNYVRDFWRAESHYVAFGSDAIDLLESIPDTNGAEWDEVLVADEILNTLPAAVGRLPHRQRLVVVWRYYDNLTFGEIAQRLGVKEATARSLLRHAIASLRSRMLGAPG